MRASVVHFEPPFIVALAGMILLRLTRFGADTDPRGSSRAVYVGRTSVHVSATLAGICGVTSSRCTSSGYSLCAVGGGTLLLGGYGCVFGALIGGLRQKLIQTDISFDGPLSSSWAKIAAGVPLFVVIALQQVTLRMARRPRFGAAGAFHP
jgi:galactofuranose transport system permease protein